MSLNNSEYLCQIDLNLYDSPSGEILATQAKKGRYLSILSSDPITKALQVRLLEDNYLAWLPPENLIHLQIASQLYQAISFSRQEIESYLPKIIDFTQAAKQISNYYLWGGTIAPNYDCSGLIQAAFSNYGIWLPRDSYQQEAFCQKISIDELLPGDLIFFGKKKVTHVALYLGGGYYIHSSSQTHGRNGIGIDQLANVDNSVSSYYDSIFWGCGRVMASYISL